jgi:hypothetical protein
MPDIKRAELEIVLEMLTTRARQHYDAARNSKGYASQQHSGQHYAYNEAASMVRDTLRGVSWSTVRAQRRALSV